MLDKARFVSERGSTVFRFLGIVIESGRLERVPLGPLVLACRRAMLVWRIRNSPHQLVE